VFFKFRCLHRQSKDKLFNQQYKKRDLKILIYSSRQVYQSWLFTDLLSWHSRPSNSND
jgi:hypothetical protein